MGCISFSPLPVKSSKIILFFLVFAFAGIAVAQDDPMKGPWQSGDAGDDYKQRATKPVNAATFFVKMLGKYIGPIDGSDCPMHPSCSRYSIECFEKHGFLMGWMMTWDRLYRCGRDELELSPWIIVRGERKCFDPLENNDRWWSNGKQ